MPAGKSFDSFNQAFVGIFVEKYIVFTPLKVFGCFYLRQKGHDGFHLGGKDKLFGFFVGQVMKATKGQASPEVVNSLLKKELKA